MLKILIAPTAFKGSLSPQQVTAAIARGITESRRQVQLSLLPLADGGDGTIETVNLALGGKVRQLEVTGPGNQRVNAHWLDLDDLSVVELASASGLTLMQGKLNPLHAHTLGLGEVLHQCRADGVRNLVVTLGGSASTDGGTAALRALGAKFYHGSGRELLLGGGALPELSGCDLSGLADFRIKMKVATDVINPLLGDNGAAAVFGPQKGATVEQVELLELGLTRLADVLELQTGHSVRDVAGAGAAGGTAFGLACGLGAEIIGGFNWIADMVNLDQKIQDSDLVITGEGRFDNQSLSGKVVGELCKRCQLLARPLWVICALASNNEVRLPPAVTRVIPLSQAGQTVGSSEIIQALSGLFSSMRSIM